MRALKESILADMDDALKSGDNYDKLYKKAEKDYKKLLNKTTGKTFGQFYQVSIKSKELAYILAGEHPAYKHYIDKNIYDIDNVVFLYNVVDTFDGERERHIQVNVLGTPMTGRKNAVTIVASHVPYTDSNETISNLPNADDGIAIKDAIKIIAEAFEKKYKNISDFRNSFMTNVKYTARY